MSEDMLQNIDTILDEAKKFTAGTIEEVEQFRIRFLGKKGVIADLFKSFREVPDEQKKQVGQQDSQTQRHKSEFVTQRHTKGHSGFTRPPSRAKQQAGGDQGDRVGNFQPLNHYGYRSGNYEQKYKCCFTGHVMLFKGLSY